MKRLAVLALAAAAIASPGAADVAIPSRPDGYTESVDIGEIAFLTEIRSRNGVPCKDPFERPCAVLSISTEWSPFRDFPVQVAVVRDRRGFELQFASLLVDRAGRSTCIKLVPLRANQAKSARLLWREMLRQFDQWAGRCDTVRIIGKAGLRAALQQREGDFRRGFARLAAVSPGKMEARPEQIGLNSFLPRRTSQPTLDAVTAACAGPRERLRLNADRTIAWNFDGNQPNAPDGSRSFDSCVDSQIQYFPGYPKRS